MGRYLLSTTALAVIASGACAQDAGHDWNGWFAGAQLGFNQHTATFEDPDYDWYGSTQDFVTPGLGLGVQLGYNIVRDNVLTGFVVDVSAMTNDGYEIYASDNQVPNTIGYLATLRGRQGLAVDDTMVYGTAGLAFADFDRSWTEFNDVSDTWPDLGATKTGVALGFGVEHAIGGGWSVSADYLASIFGENISVNDDGFPMRINDTIHSINLAVNYQFGGDRGTASGGYGTPADFGGAYVGALLGYGASEIARSDIEFNNMGGTYDVGADGGIVGLAGGYNWQSGAMVYGVEARLDTASMSANYDAYYGEIDVSVDQSFSLRGRTGVAVNDALMYVLGGVTLANVTNTYGSEEDLSGRYGGLTVGFGVEQMMSDTLSWNVEASYTRLDGIGESDNAEEGHADYAQVTAALNYHIGGTGSGGTGALAPGRDWSGGFYGADFALLANKASIWDQDYEDYGGTFDVTSLGAGIGGHAGYNWQSGSFVYGVLGDLALYSNNATRTADSYREIESRLRSMATLRGRAGIATGDSMFYATGGLALAQSDLTYTYLPSTSPEFDLSDTRAGAVVGLGVEHAMSETTSFKVEALMTRFDDKSYFNGDDCSGPAGFSGEDCNMDGWDDNVQIKAGLSWAF
ncbi:MAG: outer membrane beta-barrel protein [Alphaproteobacteria bacterium]|jgi:outer membrane immunogenic protein|nr:outer membrane beta-barrel protein [Alphaproteobacteria bacterium]